MIRVHNLNTVVHPDDLIEDLFTCGIDDRHARDAHAACAIYHLAIESNNVQGSVIDFGVGWASMRKRVAFVEVFRVRLVEDVVASRAGFFVCGS